MSATGAIVKPIQVNALHIRDLVPRVMALAIVAALVVVTVADTEAAVTAVTPAVTVGELALEHKVIVVAGLDIARKAMLTARVVPILLLARRPAPLRALDRQDRPTVRILQARVAVTVVHVLVLRVLGKEDSEAKGQAAGATAPDARKVVARSLAADRAPGVLFQEVGLAQAVPLHHLLLAVANAAPTVVAPVVLDVLLAEQAVHLVAAVVAAPLMVADRRVGLAQVLRSLATVARELEPPLAAVRRQQVGREVAAEVFRAADRSPAVVAPVVHLVLRADQELEVVRSAAVAHALVAVVAVPVSLDQVALPTEESLNLVARAAAHADAVMTEAVSLSVLLAA